MNNGWWLLTVITAVLATLKITGNIALSWLWVFAPIWIPFSVGFVLFVILTACFISYNKQKKQKEKDEKEN